MLIIAAWVVGIAAMDRFNKGQTEPAWALVLICVVCILASTYKSVHYTGDK